MIFNQSVSSDSRLSYQDSALLLVLFFSQGLPMGLAWLGLPPWLRQQGYSVETIGWLGIALLPWAVKFLWSAYIESRCIRYGNGRVLALIQLAASLSFLALAFISGSHATLLIMAVLLANVVCATQDIATDRYAIKKQGTEQSAQVSTLRFVGFTLGMLAGGPVFLILIEPLSWTFFHGICALWMFGIAWLSWRVVTTDVALLSISTRAKVSLRQFLAHQPNRWKVLGVALLFKGATGLSNNMIQTSWVDSGYSLDQVAQLSTLNLVLLGMIGAPIGHYLIRKIRVSASKLILFGGIFQALVIALLGLSIDSENEWKLFGLSLMVILPAALAILDGMVSLTCLSLFMNWSKGAQPGTDFTIFLSAESLGTIAFSIFAGSLAGLLGYSSHFLLSSVLVFCAVFYIFNVVKSIGNGINEA
ncbi:MFS transporter [Marinomonas transparens]|uniref:MFS transporter n=1 Tax=Marinomonas transparens TaxID=2795388 RepID=A0A934JMR1_9GAMM|nr:MFS transporter [Marinomonas transparens]MBJ7536373.1 hypothetical protein [Marinomonas transparens]